MAPIETVQAFFAVALASNVATEAKQDKLRACVLTEVIRLKVKHIGD